MNDLLTGPNLTDPSWLDGWPTAIYEYVIVYRDRCTGHLTADTLVGASDDHAREEATYECNIEESEDIVAIQRKDFLYWQ